MPKPLATPATHEDNPHRNEAARLLQHYISVAVKRAGGKWDHDNDVEVAIIVDGIIDATIVAIDNRTDARLAGSVPLSPLTDHERAVATRIKNAQRRRASDTPRPLPHDPRD